MNLFAPIHVVILLITALLPLGLIMVAIIIAINGVRRAQRRADERLELDKHRTELLQQQLQEINHRLTAIEAMLRDVE